MVEFENPQEETKEIRKQRSNKRIFGVLIALDIILFGVIVYEIVELIISLTQAI